LFSCGGNKADIMDMKTGRRSTKTGRRSMKDMYAFQPMKKG